MIQRTLFKINKHLIPHPTYYTNCLNRLTCVSRHWFATNHLNGYTPPESQLNKFVKLISDIDNKQSMNAAAQCMAQLEIDQQLCKQKLLAMHDQIKDLDKRNPQAADIINHSRKLQIEMNSYIEESKELQQRSAKQLDKIKVYGISKIAKEVIEILDHLTQSIAILQKQNSTANKASITELHKLYQQLSQLFLKYHIYQFNPEGEVFDPNLHQSVGHIKTNDAKKKNLIAETKRTGFKLKDRLLRSAYVVIYM